MTDKSPFLKRLIHHAHQDPIHDWFILMTIAGILLVVVLVWNAWIFDTIASGGSIGKPADTGRPFFDQSSLNAIHTVFTSRAEEQAKYITGTYRFTDPSQ